MKSTNQISKKRSTEVQGHSHLLLAVVALAFSFIFCQNGYAQQNPPTPAWNQPTASFKILEEYPKDFPDDSDG